MKPFFLDRDPEAAARAHCDRDLGKGLIETVRILRAAARHRGRAAADGDDPMVRWAGESRDNWLWLRQFALCLGAEIEYRTGRTHDGIVELAALDSVIDGLPARRFAEPGLSVPDDCKKGDAVARYRAHYRRVEPHAAAYTRRPPPDFMR
jgi:hypothetical protein